MANNLTVHRRKDQPALIFFDDDGSAEIHDGCHGQYMSVSKMRSVLIYAEAYIKEFQNDDAVDHMNKNLIIEALYENAERRDERKGMAVEKVERQATGCSIYLIEDVARKCFKIGKANNTTARFKQLKTANPCIRLVADYKGLTTDEFALHRHFDGFGKRIDGEWFALNLSDVEYFHEYFSQYNPV